MSAEESVFLKACRREPVPHIPVWFMRQAGRSLSEYRAVREQLSLLEIIKRPEVAAEVTIQPVWKLGVDAAILFSDIVVPLEPMGVDLEIVEGVGPVIADPIGRVQDIERLTPVDPENDLAHVLKTIDIVSQEIDEPVIAFGGAPFTLASYLVDGGPSRNHEKTKALMYSEPQTWSKLMDRLTETIGSYIKAQVGAGARAVQLFDSWVGHLDPQSYRQFVAPWSERILTGLSDLEVPRIHFGVGTGELLAEMVAVGADVIGVDWRVPLDEARARVGEGPALQGNLDPAVCLAPWDVVSEAAADVLRRGGGRGHIFNLGHGVLPQTNPDVLERLVDFVHDWTPQA